MDGFVAGEHFSLALLLIEDGKTQGLSLVEYGDFTLSVLTDGNLGLAQSIGRAGGLDLIDDLVVL